MVGNRRVKYKKKKTPKKSARKKSKSLSPEKSERKTSFQEIQLRPDSGIIDQT